MSFRWPKEGVSVVLLPSGELGREMLELAHEWTKHRVLAPALYVVVEEQSEIAASDFQKTGPVAIPAHIIGRDGSVVDSLIRQLAQNDLNLVKVLACRFVEDNSSFHEIQDRIVDRIRTQIESSAPQREESNGITKGTKLLLLNLISGPSMRSGGSTEHLLEFQWDANIILSPENRSTPSGFDAFSLESEPSFSGFILSNIASAIGLWTGINKSILELSGMDSSATYDKVIVQRTFGRIVKTDGISIRMAASALKDIELYGSPVVDPTFVLKDKKQFTDKEFEAAISELVTDTLKADNAALKFDFEKKNDDDKKEAISFLDGLKLLGAFLWEKIVTFPRNLLEAIIQTFNKKATQLLFGEESDIVIDAHKDLRRFGIRTKDAEDLIKIAAVKDTVREVLDDVVLGPAYRGQHPQLWRQQRNLILEVLDGKYQNFPDKVLANTEKLIPKYGNTWSIPEFLLDHDEDPATVISSLEWLDVDEAERILKDIDADLDLFQEELRDYRREMLEADQVKAASKASTREVRTEHDREVAKNRALNMILGEYGNDNA